jgi:uncharacterized protein YegP (UPF0339 family)
MWTVVRSVLLAVVAAGILGVLSFQVTPAQQKKGADKGADAKTGAAVFEMYKDKGGKFRFRMTQGDELLAIAGHGYATKEDCQKVIDTIRRVAARAKVEVSTK